MSAITEEEVMNVVHQLIADGKIVSLNKVREILQHGSYSSIKKILIKNNVLTPRIAKTEQYKNIIEDSITHNNDLIRNLKENKLSLQLQSELLQKNIINTKQKIEEEIKIAVLNEIILFILCNHINNQNIIKDACNELELSSIVSAEHRSFIINETIDMKKSLITSFIKTIDALLIAENNLAQQTNNTNNVNTNSINNTNNTFNYNSASNLNSNYTYSTSNNNTTNNTIYNNNTDYNINSLKHSFNDINSLYAIKRMLIDIFEGLDNHGKVYRY
jgi:hypothetical protein